MGKIVKITWKKSDPFILVNGEKVNVSCVVRNELNGFRSLENPEDVVYTSRVDGGPNAAYMPRTFPDGSWTITDIKTKTDPYMAPYLIVTDAHQPVNSWSLTDHGCYHAKNVQTVEDGGYCLHNSTSPTTLGCVRVLDDIHWLVAQIQAAWAIGETVTFEVTT